MNARLNQKMDLIVKCKMGTGLIFCVSCKNRTIFNL